LDGLAEKRTKPTTATQPATNQTGAILLSAKYRNEVDTGFIGMVLISRISVGKPADVAIGAMRFSSS
jgi:hypothetical protein